MTSSRSNFAPGSVGSLLHSATALLPGFAFRREAAAFEVGEGGRVGSDHAGARAGLDAHVADGHAAFHRKGANGGAGVFDDAAGGAVGADLADDGEDDVFGGDAAWAARLRPRCGRSWAWIAAGSAWRARARLRWCRCRRPSAPNAPWVEVCESPQTMVMPGLVMPSSGPMTCTMPCSRESTS